MSDLLARLECANGTTIETTNILNLKTESTAAFAAGVRSGAEIGACEQGELAKLSAHLSHPAAREIPTVAAERRRVLCTSAGACRVAYALPDYMWRSAPGELMARPAWTMGAGAILGDCKDARASSRSG